MNIQDYLRKPAYLSFLQQNVLKVAPQLLGHVFETPHHYVILGEIEAYDATNGDEACHAFPHVTPKCEILTKSGGYIYVYIIYGIHFCVNITAGLDGQACGSLIRGGWVFEKQKPYEAMYIEGPARLTKKLGITKKENGLLLGQKDFQLWQTNISIDYKTTERIGITKSKELLWRFVTCNKDIHTFLS